ncbi:MAG: 7-carboxy-7-deazaguanine synthase QueE [Methanomethylophilus sp.]
MRIVETFLSIQGEGLQMGRLTYFVRTAGCNLRCSWCDTGYALNDSDAKCQMTPDEVLKLIGDVNSICLTGGEPLLQKDAREFIEKAIEAGKTLVLETNGSMSIAGLPDSENLIVSMDIKCPSSGMQDRMDLDNLAHLKRKDQLKFVIGDEEDLAYAEEFISKHPTEANVIFSPVGGVSLEKLANEVISKRLDVRVLPQLHKIIWGDRKGV